MKKHFLVFLNILLLALVLNAQQQVNMEVEGVIKIADIPAAVVPDTGMIRWNPATLDFEGFTGSEWVSFTQVNTNNGWGQNNFNSTENDYVVGSQGGNNHYFGRGGDLNGNYAIYGGTNAGYSGYTDIAYIFHDDGSGFAEQKILTSGSGVYENFGGGVAINGSYAFVGANSANVGDSTSQGKVYVYRHIGMDWPQHQALASSDGRPNSFFGTTVAMDGNYAIVGAIGANVGDSTFQGKAYIFINNGGTWEEEAILTASDGRAGDRFGFAVDIFGDYAIVGIGNFGGGTGKAYIFHRSGTAWTEEAILVPSDGNSGDYFGAAVSISNDYAVAGTRFHNSNTGKAYVYNNNGGNWDGEVKITASDAAVAAEFGVSVDIEGSVLVVGANGVKVNGHQNHGKAYVYELANGNWEEQATLVGSDGGALDGLGFVVKISGQWIAASAIFNNNNNQTNRGKVYFFSKN